MTINKPKLFILVLGVFCMSFGLNVNSQAAIAPRFGLDVVPQSQQDSIYAEEIAQLQEAETVREALSYIQSSDKQTIEDQIQLTELPAPPFKEHDFGRGEHFARLLRDYGADSVWTDSIGNVIGLRKGTEGSQTMALAAHLDTVFPEGTDVSVTQKGDTLFAPGISDDVRGLTAILAVLRAMDEAELRTKDDILFIGDVGEEGLGDLRGMKYLFREGGPRIDSFISIDGSGDRRIVNGALGSHRYRVTYKGPGGHSWGAFGLANPHHALGRAISLFVDKADQFTAEGPKTSYNVGRISGGTSVNSIPFESWMEVDMRSISTEKLNGIDALLQESVEEALEKQNEIRREGPALTVDVEMIGDRPSGETDPSDPLVQRASAAIRANGKEPVMVTSSTDSNIPISMGIPAITMSGGGEGGGAHSLDEWYINKDGYKGIQQILLIVTAQTGLAES